MKKDKNIFKTDIKDLSIITEKKAEFILNSAKEKLNYTLKFSNQISNKNLLLLIGYISLSTFIISSVLSAKFNFLLFIPILIGLLVAIISTITNLFSLNFDLIGHEPKNIFNQKVCEKDYDIMLLSSASLYQNRIEFNRSQNEIKRKRVEFSIIVFVIGAFLNIIYSYFISSLSALCC